MLADAFQDNPCLTAKARAEWGAAAAQGIDGMRLILVDEFKAQSFWRGGNG